jgi:eukaryotic-like serine/threonine-protein kinase
MSSTMGRLTAALSDRYRIERELGAGGMATVYLAEDLKHRRRVAVKVLKPELAAVLGADRFVQEITTTAALQHPHILPLFDSGEADGFLFYVMPFIDGETLRAKLDRETQLGVTEAVRIATEVADALHYAHQKGVIHRDIKPENILLANGRPMVADFGIALAVSAAAGGRMTETGLSLGTPHYMSPEQATAAKEISGRADIYSLASVLYEMLTGNPPHTGASAQQIIMKIITEPAAAVTSLRKAVPANVGAAVAQALEKLPADRFATAAEFAGALADRGFGAEGAAGAVASTGRNWQGWLRAPQSWAALVIIAALASVAYFAGPSGPEAPHGPRTIRFTVSGPADSSVLSMSVRAGTPLAEPVVSGDGRHVAFSVNRSDGPALFVRELDSFTLFEVPGDGHWPFFSADGASLGFFTDSDVWSMDLADRRPTRVGSVPEQPWDITSAVWHPDGRILVTGARGLWVLPERGGAPTLLLATDSTAGERFTEVAVLRDGRIMLAITERAGARTELMSADGSNRTAIVPGYERVRVVEDIMFFVQAGQPRAVRVDLRRVVPVGEPIALTEFPSQRPARSIAWIDGVRARELEPVWVSATGVITPLGLPGALYRWPRVSPDGGRLVAGIDLPGSERTNLHVVELRRRTTASLGGYTEPVWSGDGRRVYTSRGNRPLGGLLVQVADGSMPPDTLLRLESGDAWPTSVSPDDRWLAYYGATLGVGADGAADDPNDILFMDVESRETSRVRLPGAQRGARFSPDGKWVAYESTESGREEVHVRPWPGMDATYRISNDGGSEPAWSPRGDELYFRHRNDMLAVEIAERDGALERSAPRVLFSGVFNRDQYGDQSYDVAPDGRFLMMRPLPGHRVELRVALNWIAEIRARLERVQ